MKGLLAVVVAVVSTACGGKSPGPASPHTGSGSGSGTTDSGSHAPAPVAAALTEQECDQLLDHTVELELSQAAPDQKLDEKEQKTVRDSVRDKFLAGCRKLTRDRYDCAMAAKATAEMEACDQASRKSSTSNSSVAPGGMTPAAPRSP